MIASVILNAIWNREDDSKSSSSVSRFNRSAETVSSEESIKVVYGQRRVTGNQTYHKSDPESMTLYKHTCFCEGGIYGLVSLTASDLVLPTDTTTLSYASSICPVVNANGEVDNLTVVDINNPQPSETLTIANNKAVFSILNRTHDNAVVQYKDKTLSLIVPEKMFSVDLKNGDDYEDGGDFWDYQVDVSALISFINHLGYGWEAFPLATTKDYPADLYCGITSGTQDVANNKFLTFFFCSDSDATGGSSFCFHNNTTPANYEEVGAYPNIAWVEATFKDDSEFSGNPTLEALIDGRCIYDTRYGCYCYSLNPAMILRDFLLNKSFGAGQWITEDMLDEASFKESADWCDKWVTYEKTDGTRVTKHRYEMNIVIDSKKKAWDWIEDMLATFCGYISMSKGKLSLHVEKPSPVVYKFNTSNIKDLSLSQRSIEDTPNRYEISFVDPENNWEATTVIVEDYADQEERGRSIVKQVNLEGVTSQSQALRLGRFYRDYNKICTLNITFKTGYQASHLEIGDVVTISYKDVIQDMPIRVLELKETAEGEFEITGRQYNESIYNDDLGATLTNYNYCPRQISYGVIPAPTNLQLKQDYYLDKEGNSHSTVTLSWNDAPYGLTKSYDIYRQEQGKELVFIANTPSISFVINEPIGTTVKYAVCTHTEQKTSNLVYTNDIYIEGKDYPPNPVTSLTAKIKSQSLLITWSPPSDLDIMRYKVIVNGEVLYTSTTQIYAPCQQGNNTIEVLVEDYGNNLSTSETYSLVANLKPSKPLGLNAYFNGGIVYVQWEAVKGADYYSFTGGSVYSQKTYSTSYSFPVTTAKEYTCSVKSVNEYGESDSSSVSITVEDTDLTEENVTESFDLVNGGSCIENCHVANGIIYKDI